MLLLPLGSVYYFRGGAKITNPPLFIDKIYYSPPHSSMLVVPANGEEMLLTLLFLLEWVTCPLLSKTKVTGPLIFPPPPPHINNQHSQCKHSLKRKRRNRQDDCQYVHD